MLRDSTNNSSLMSKIMAKSVENKNITEIQPQKPITFILTTNNREEKLLQQLDTKTKISSPPLL